MIDLQVPCGKVGVGVRSIAILESIRQVGIISVDRTWDLIGGRRSPG